MTSRGNEYEGLGREIQEESDTNSNGDEIVPSNGDEIVEDIGSDPRAQPHLNFYAVICAMGASMASILLGFDVGAMIEGMTYVKKDKRVTDMQVDVLSGLLHLVSLLGSIVAGQTSNRIGRRYTIIITGVCFFFGTLLMAFGLSNFVLLSGRIVTHFGIGFALMIAPVYISEISPDFFRGLLICFPELFMNVGILLGYLCNYPTSNVNLDLARTLMATLAIISMLLLLIGALAMPESPRWLAMRGRVRDARRVLAKTSRSEAEADRRIDNIKEVLGIPLESNADVVAVSRLSTEDDVFWSLIYSTPYIRHMLICAVLVHLLQQACGIDAILLYSPRILEKAGVTLPNAKLLWTIKVQLVKTAILLVPTFSLDWIGRRKLLLSSLFCMILSLASLGTCLKIMESSNPTNKSDTKHTLAAAICLPSLLCYVASFSIGMGPVTSVYSTEILPLTLRAQGYAIGVAINQALSALLSATFLLLYTTSDLGTAAFLFMGIACFALVLIFVMMPETQGQQLEDMWRLFGTYTAWMSRARQTDAQRRSGVREIEMQTNVGGRIQRRE